MKVLKIKLKALCDISELPTRLRRMALYNKEHMKHNSGEPMSCNTVNAFVWKKTPEGEDFWCNVYNGWTPKNLEEVLNKFEKEHPELFESKQEEITTEKTEEKKNAEQAYLWPCVRCTKQEYYEQIQPNLTKWRWYVRIEFYWDKYDNIIHTNCMGQERIVGRCCEMAEGDYLCPDIETFLHDCQEIAIRKGWFKLEQEETISLSSTIDWEQRRYEIAKECLVAFNSNNNPQICDSDSVMRANWAISDADALIKKLKKEKVSMEKTLTLAQKIELARWIQEVNGANVLLTGSLMLHLRGIDLGREPQDIDFIISNEIGIDDIILLPFTEIIETPHQFGYTTAGRYMYAGIKIEFLRAEPNEFKQFKRFWLEEYLFHKHHTSDIKLAPVAGLLAAKKEYVANDTSEESKEKHRRDIDIIEKWLDKNK